MRGGWEKRATCLAAFEKVKAAIQVANEAAAALPLPDEDDQDDKKYSGENDAEECSWLKKIQMKWMLLNFLIMKMNRFSYSLFQQTNLTTLL